LNQDIVFLFFAFFSYSKKFFWEKVYSIFGCHACQHVFGGDRNFLVRTIQTKTATKEINWISNLKFQESAPSLYEINLGAIQSDWTLDKGETSKFRMVILDVKVTLACPFNQGMQSRH
jgi:hypothetical protein